ncbi:MAG: 8-amino-7-oxononanoate synthase [Thermodesulfobacteriota bacterium]|nr:8-amino-7-oxononanoate synthase [Thermodesulfobacteriota bacterium]
MGAAGGLIRANSQTTINMGKFDFIDATFEARRQANQVRRLRDMTPLDGAYMQVDGRRLLNCCSNDYLGLSRHPLLAERAGVFAQRYGAGATASRLVCGNYPCFSELEARLAWLKQTSAALILNAGYQANATLLPALCDRAALILSDELNHNSIINGCRLARCTVKRYAHNDPQDLERLLAENADQGFSRIVIVTETVFSMDGDIVDLDALVSLAETYNAILMVDEAHATGVFGEKGMGLSCGKAVDVVMGTFGKGGGGFGAYVACSGRILEYLVNYCQGFIYSTGLPPAVVGEIDAALELIPEMEDRRRMVLENAAWFRERMAGLGLDTGPSASQIVPVVVGDENDALDLSRYLEEKGFLVVAIRPPSVPPKKSRVRVSLSALHTRADVERLADAFEQWRAA